MDYDTTKIHEEYDIARSLPQSTLSLWLDSMSAQIEGSLDGIADVGCGTGRFTYALSKKFKTSVVGIDPSEKMLSIAKKRDRNNHNIRYLLGECENIPIPDKSVSMIFLSMAFHHIKDIDSAVIEMSRVLRPAGYVVIRNATKEDILKTEMFKFFPEARVIELDRMPSVPFVSQVFREKRRFELVSIDEIRQLFADSYLEYYSKIAKRALSILNLITDDEYQSGLEKFHDYCKEQPVNKKVFEQFHLLIFKKVL